MKLPKFMLLCFLTGCMSNNISPPFTSEKSNKVHAQLIAVEKHGYKASIYQVDETCVRQDFLGECRSNNERKINVLTGIRNISLNCTTFGNFSFVNIEFELEANKIYSFICGSNDSDFHAFYTVTDEQGNNVPIKITDNLEKDKEQECL